MVSDYLEFEQPIAELEVKINELRRVELDNEMQLGDEIARLEAKSRALTEAVYKNLSAWQVAQIARHPRRPYMLDYVEKLFKLKKKIKIQLMFGAMVSRQELFYMLMNVSREL